MRRVDLGRLCETTLRERTGCLSTLFPSGPCEGAGPSAGAAMGSLSLPCSSHYLLADKQQSGCPHLWALHTT